MKETPRLRILIPILGFAREGGYRVLSELANHWVALGHECTFLVPASSTDPYFPTQALIIRFDRKGRVHESQTNTPQSGIDNLMSIWKGIRAIANDYDILLANHSLTAWPVRFSGATLAKKFYYVQAYEPLYYPFLRSPVKKLMALGSYWLGLNMIANASIYPITKARICEVVPPGVDLSVFYQKAARHAGEHPAVRTIGTIGRAEPHKGTATVVAAYRKLRQEREDILLHIALGNVAKAPDMCIVDIENDSQLADFYRSIDILVVACRGQHGAPHYPLIEAMACGTAVVHTGYFPGTNENSWQANGASIEALAETVDKLLNVPEEEISNKTMRARKYIERELSWPVVAHKFLDCFMANRDGDLFRQREDGE